MLQIPYYKSKLVLTLAWINWHVKLTIILGKRVLLKVIRIWSGLSKALLFGGDRCAPQIHLEVPEGHMDVEVKSESAACKSSDLTHYLCGTGSNTFAVEP